MATKKVAAPAKKGRPANPANATAKAKDTKPIVTFLPPKLHARAKLACLALSTNLSTVIRGLLAEWVVSKKKAIADVVNMKDDNDEVEEEEDDVEVEEDEDEEVEEDDDEDDE